MLSLAACATAAPTPKALPHAPMDAVLADAVGPEGYLGAVAVVAERGTVVYRGVFGHADLQGRQPLREDAIFRLYSMSKPVISVAALMLADWLLFGMRRRPPAPAPAEAGESVSPPSAGGVRI